MQILEQGSEIQKSSIYGIWHKPKLPLRGIYDRQKARLQLLLTGVRPTKQLFTQEITTPQLFLKVAVDLMERHVKLGTKTAKFGPIRLKNIWIVDFMFRCSRVSVSNSFYSKDPEFRAEHATLYLNTILQEGDTKMRLRTIPKVPFTKSISYINWNELENTSSGTVQLRSVKAFIINVDGQAHKLSSKKRGNGMTLCSLDSFLNLFNVLGVARPLTFTLKITPIVKIWISSIRLTELIDLRALSIQCRCCKYIL